MCSISLRYIFVILEQLLGLNEREIYLRSLNNVSTQKRAPTEMLAGKYKLAYGFGEDIDVFSQVLVYCTGILPNPRSGVGKLFTRRTRFGRTVEAAGRTLIGKQGEDLF